MDPILAGIFTASLFKAIEKILDKTFDAAWDPVDSSLKQRFNALAGKGKLTERKQAFARACLVAEKITIRQSHLRFAAKKIFAVLNRDADKFAVEELASEAAKVILLSDQPNLEHLTSIIKEKIQWDSFWGNETPPANQDIMLVIQAYLDNLKQALMDEEIYSDLIQKEILRVLRSIHEKMIITVRYDGDPEYIAQLIHHNQNLDFVGIPELKDRQSLRVEDIFIHLRNETHQPDDDNDTAKLFQYLLLSRDVVLTNQQILESNVILESSISFYRNLSKDLLKPRLIDKKIQEPATLTDSIQGNNRIIILGDPGSGKTTLLKYIILAHAENHPERIKSSQALFPIFIRLYDFASRQSARNTDYSLIDYLYTQAHENYLIKLPPGYFETRLATGNCCICLDGLDELGDSGLRHKITQSIDSLANHYPGNQLIITSRIVGYQDAPFDSQSYTSFTIMPLTDDDIKKFVEKWYLAREKDPVRSKSQTAHLIKTIMSEPRIRMLASNPLMLTIIALVHRIEAELPNERVKLYDKCVVTLIETWDKVKELRSDQNQPAIRYRRRLLECLAYWMHSQSGESGRAYEIRRGDLLHLLQQFLLENEKLDFSVEDASEEASLFLSTIESRSGILYERGEKTYSFVHLTFQEYLAACYLEHRFAHSIESLWKIIQPRLFEPHWREVILLLFGSLNKFEHHPTELLQNIFDQSDQTESLTHRSLWLCVHILSDNVEVKFELRKKIQDELLAILRQGGFWENKVIELIKYFINEKHVVHGLLDLASDKSVAPQIRVQVIISIGKLQSYKSEASFALEKIFHDQKENINLRLVSALYIGLLGFKERAGSLLIDFIEKKPKSSSARLIAIEFLGVINENDPPDKSSVAFLLSLPDKDPILGRALAMIHRLDIALPKLIDSARNSFYVRKFDERYRSIFSLGIYGESNPQVINTLLFIAEDTTEIPGLRIAACEALMRLREIGPALNILVKLISSPLISVKEKISILQALSRVNLEKGDIGILVASLILIQSNSIQLNYEIVNFFRSHDQVELAKIYFNKFSSAHPKRLEDQLVLAKMRFSLSQGQSASAMLKSIVENQDLSTLVRARALRILFDSGNEQDALDLLIKFPVLLSCEIPNNL